MSQYVIVFRVVSNAGEVIKDDFYYNHEPELLEVMKDLEDFMKESVPAYYYEHPEVNANSRKWYSGLDVIGWIND